MKENKQAHTPTPWHIIKVPLSQRVAYQVRPEKGLPVIETSHEANATFIVKACNSHEALVEACKALEQFETTPDKDVVTISYKAIERARKALKLAEEA